MVLISHLRRASACPRISFKQLGIRRRHDLSTEDHRPESGRAGTSATSARRSDSRRTSYDLRRASSERQRSRRMRL